MLKRSTEPLPESGAVLRARTCTTDEGMMNIDQWAQTLRELHLKRNRRSEQRRTGLRKRSALTVAQRKQILQKSGSRCHLCGGFIKGDWEADHVFPHSAGGGDVLANFLPAHKTCNNYRWHYDGEEFQIILKLGVWLRTQIEKKTTIGLTAGKAFLKHETRRKKRSKK